MVTTTVKPSASIEVDAFGQTARGRKREENEDQFLVAELKKALLVTQTTLPLSNHSRVSGPEGGQLLVVADGMGGHGDGGTASAVAVRTVVRSFLDEMPWLSRLEEENSGAPEEKLAEVLRKCHSQVRYVAGKQGRDPNMGTTLTVAYVAFPQAYIVHAGDSRCYLFRSGELKQVTRDHSLAQQLVDKEVLTPDGAEDSRWNNQLWNAVGAGLDAPSAETTVLDLEPEDVLFLCTDGLTKHVDDRAIAQEFSTMRHAETTVNRLIDIANAAGGTDNLTAVISRFAKAGAVDRREATLGIRRWSEHGGPRPSEEVDPRVTRRMRTREQAVSAGRRWLDRAYVTPREEHSCYARIVG